MLNKTIFILGRQPAIGRAELESLYGGDHLRVTGESAVVSDLATSQISFYRLGSVVKFGEILQIVDSHKWSDIQAAVIKNIVNASRELASGKLQLGLSAYGLKTNVRQLTAVGLEAKKALRQTDRSVRLVQNQELTLSSAQVLHNHLTTDRGLEILLINDGNQIIIARTRASQDINAYARRDRERPKRDPFIGMLPPKLAQTIVNLAAAQTDPKYGAVLLDPFCGTGVVLQEATLMGFDVYGSDIDPRMVDYTNQNLQWLLKINPNITNHSNSAYHIEIGDATNHKWSPPPNIIACETYLGRPLSSWPSSDNLKHIMGACNVIIEKFLLNVHAQLKTGNRLCIAVPCWVAPSGQFYHLPALDHLEKIGYNRVSFEHARSKELVYYRPDQLVGRELVIITRK